MKEFFGIGGYTRMPEGAYSWQHLTFVGSLLIVMTILALWLGKNNCKKSAETKNRALIAAALLIDGLELLKIVLACYNGYLVDGRWYDGILLNLPLFLCSIQLITIPLAAFSKGQVRESALDFVAIFGLLGAVLGTVGAAQNYNAYPVLGFDNVVSGLTHCISGFAALYVMRSGMSSLQKQDVPLTFAILGFFCVAAYVANVLIPYNYMFLMAGDGTPYDILYNLVGGHKVFYPLCVVALFLLYISAFYGIHYAIVKKKQKVTA